MKKHLPSILFLFVFFLSAERSMASFIYTFNNDSCLVADTISINMNCNPAVFNLSAYNAAGIDSSCGGDADDAHWFAFEVDYPNIIIEVAPSANMDVVIEFFTGNTCGSLISETCVNEGGVAITESLELIGLTLNEIRYFRVFDALTGSPLDSSFSVCIYHAPCPEAIITPSGPTVFCSGDNVVLTASSGDFYTWSTGSNEQSITVNTSGSYTVTVIDFASGCSSTSQAINISVNPLPPNFVSVAGSTTLCEGESVNISAIFGANLAYQWRRNGIDIEGATNRVFTASLNGTYNVLITNINTGCNNLSGNVNVTIVSPPDTTYTHTNPTEICGTGNINLSVAFQSGVMYQWFRNDTLIPGAMANNYVATQNGIYYVSLTKSVCIKTSTPIEVSFLPLPIANFPSGNSSAVCEGDSAFIIGNPIGGAVYAWFFNNNPIAGANQSFIIASAFGIYRYNIIDTNGCEAGSGDYILDQLSNPVLELSAETLSACVGDSLLLRAIADREVSYTWQRDFLPINDLDQDTIFASQSGSYRFIAIDNQGCTAISNSLQITIFELPVVEINPDQFPVCFGDQVMLTSSGNNQWSFQWFFNDIPIENSNTITIEANQPGIYTVLATNENACSNLSDELNLIFFSAPEAPVISTLDSTSFCEGGFAGISLQDFNESLVYQWLFNNIPIQGINGENYFAFENGNYTVQLTDSNGCQAISNAISIEVFPLPTVNLILPFDTLCSNAAPVELTGGFPVGGFYFGQAVTNGSLFNPSQANTLDFSIIVYDYIDANGCATNAIDSIFVDVCTFTDLSTALSFDIFPNPAKDVLHLQFNTIASSLAELSIFDMKGAVVFRQNGHFKEQIQINTTELKPGIYFVRYTDMQKQIIKKFSKQ
jgi:hypothetical protein